MTRSSNLETWVQIAKVAATAGEMAPFPYIKGLCGCVVLILEAIQKADKNDEDLLDLAESIGKTVEMIQNAVIEHGESSALCFRDVCTELELYLTNLLTELNSARRKSRGFKRFLKTNKVSDAVTGYQERVRAIKADFLIHTAIDSRFVISDIKDGLKTSTDALTSAIETSQRHTISNIDKHADSIYEEIHTWGVLQSKKADELSAEVQALKERSSYKGYVRDFLPGDIYLRDHLDYPDDETAFTHHNADVGNTPKIVRVYRRSTHSKLNEQDVIRQFHIDVDKLIKFKHQNIAQVFGVCRSPEFTAIVLHGTTRQTISDYRDSLTATQFLHFNMQLVNDLESASDCLNRFYRMSRQGWEHFAFAFSGRQMYINEGGRIVLAELSSSYRFERFQVNISQHPAVWLCRRGRAPATPAINLIRDWNSLMHPTSLDKSHLIKIYDVLYHFMEDGYRPLTFRLGSDCSLGSVLVWTEESILLAFIRVGKILIESIEWDSWDLKWNGCSIPFPTCSRSFTNHKWVSWDVEWSGCPMPFSTCSGSLTIHNLSVIKEHSLRIVSEGCWTSKYDGNTQQMMYSWFAQASRLSLSCQNIRSIDHRLHDTKYIGVCYGLSFDLDITPCYDPFQLLDTFMVDGEDTFALSLTICEPRFDSQSNTFSWPVIHWFCDSSLSNEISVEEVEALFGIQVSFSARPCICSVPEKAFSTIVEINTMCGFDPALEGADICEYFDLPRMEIFEDPIEVFYDHEIDQTALPVAVRDRKDASDVTPVTHIRAEKESSASSMQNRLVVALIALNIVLLSLVIRSCIGV